MAMVDACSSLVLALALGITGRGANAERVMRTKKHDKPCIAWPVGLSVHFHSVGSGLADVSSMSGCPPSTYPKPQWCMYPRPQPGHSRTYPPVTSCKASL